MVLPSDVTSLKTALKTPLERVVAEQTAPKTTTATPIVPTAPTTPTKTTTTVIVRSRETDAAKIAAGEPTVQSPSNPLAPTPIQSIEQQVGKTIPTKTTTATPSVTTTTTPTTPLVPSKNVISPFEQLLGKTNPLLAQQMYASRTGLPEEKLIYERQQEIHGPYTPTGARQVAIQQLERENILAEGYGGITTIRKTPTITSTGYDKYGYQPESYTYSTILGGMQTSEDILKSNIEASKQAGASLSTTQKYLTEGRASLENIRSAPETATIYITELDESGKEKEVGYTKSEAVKKYETYLSDLESNYQSNKELAGRKIEFENELKRLGAEETTLQAYEQAGYKATLNENEELILSTPKASEVVTAIYGERPDLYTAQSMRSLGLQSYASAFQYGATKLIYGKESAEKVRQAEYERLSEGILGSTKQVGESNLEFTGRFWSSPETIMDVYVPVITFGAGAALSIGGKALAGTRIGTGIIQGASKSSTLVTVGRALSSTTGQVAVVGGIVAVQEAPVIYETAMEHPEMLGSTIGRATYDVGINLTSFTVGAEYGAKAYDVINRTYQQNLFEKNYEIMTSGRPLAEKTIQTSQAIDINKFAPKYQKAYDFETMADMSANKYPVAKVPEMPVNVETRTYMITKPETGEVSFISYVPEGKATVIGTINKQVGKETIMSGYRYYNVKPELTGEVISELPTTVERPGDMLGNIRTNLVSKLIREDTVIQENVFVASSKEMAEFNIGKTEMTMNVGKTSIGRYVSPSEEKLILYGSKQEPIVFPEKLRSSSVGISATKEIDAGTNVERFKFKADKTKTIGVAPEQFEKEYSGTLSEGLYSGEATKGAYRDVTVSLKVKPKGGDYYGSNMGSDTTFTAPPKTTGESISVGGISSKLLSETEYPKFGGVFDSHRKITLAELEAMESGVYTTRAYPVGASMLVLKPDTTSITRQGLATTIKLDERRKVESMKATGYLSSRLQLSKQDTVLGMRTKQDTSSISSTKTMQLTNVSTKQITNQVVSTKQEQVQLSQQKQIQLQRQMQKQIGITSTVTDMKTRFVTPREVIIKKKIKIPPPYIPKEEEVGRRRIGMVGKKKQKFTSNPMKQDKGLRADWLSVTQSQARYGTATQPKLTKATWEEGGKTAFLRVPTEELKKGGARRNIFGNKRGNKNVFK